MNTAAAGEGGWWVAVCTSRGSEGPVHGTDFDLDVVPLLEKLSPAGE
jgi:hypothetical protein